MRRRTFARLLAPAAAGIAGCVGSSAEVRAEAARAFNSGLELVEAADRAREDAHDAWERGAWGEAETGYNQARSRYRRAASRFSEARGEGAGCDALVAKAEEMLGYCSDMQRACEEWLRAAARRSSGRGAATEAREAGDRWAERAAEHTRYGPVDPESPEC